MAKDRKKARYAEKRKLRLVPLEFSAPCRELCDALKDSRIGPVRLNTLRRTHDEYLWREFR